MNLDDLGNKLRALDAAMFSVAPLKSGGWQANIRLNGSDGWTCYTGNDDETLSVVVAKTLPAARREPEGAAPPPALQGESALPKDEVVSEADLFG